MTNENTAPLLMPHSNATEVMSKAINSLAILHDNIGRVTAEESASAVEMLHDFLLNAWRHEMDALASKQVANTDVVRDAWQTIETAPQDGFMLVHEYGAIRAILRVGGEWKQIGYPAIISHPFGDSIVGKDAERMLPAGYRLELRDGCCESPTHWMPLPSPPTPQPENKP